MNTEQKSRRRPPEPEKKRKPAPAGRRAAPVQEKPPHRRPPAQPIRRRRLNAPPPQRQRRPAETPEVVYEPAKPLTRRRLVVQLATVAAIVLALIFGLSIFFRVENIVVSGAEKYSAWTVREASGIREGENLLSFGEAAARGRIITQLPYVKKVRIGIKLPNTVNIEIEEAEMTYAAEAEDGTWWLMTAEGRIVEQISHTQAQKTTVIAGLELEAPVGEQAVASRPAQSPSEPFEGDALLEAISAQRLEIVLQILQELEKNEIIGQIDHVDVTNPDDIRMSYEQRYEIRLGGDADLAKKIHALHLAVGQMSRYQTGTLDVSFTTWPDQVAFTPAEKP